VHRPDQARHDVHDAAAERAWSALAIVTAAKGLSPAVRHQKNGSKADAWRSLFAVSNPVSGLALRGRRVRLGFIRNNGAGNEPDFEQGDKYADCDEYAGGAAGDGVKLLRSLGLLLQSPFPCSFAEVCGEVATHGAWLPGITLGSTLFEGLVIGRTSVLRAVPQGTAQAADDGYAPAPCAGAAVAEFRGDEIAAVERIARAAIGDLRVN
jgi:hypothetical protein